MRFRWSDPALAIRSVKRIGWESRSPVRLGLEVRRYAELREDARRYKKPISRNNPSQARTLSPDSSGMSSLDHQNLKLEGPVECF